MTCLSVTMKAATDGLMCLLFKTLYLRLFGTSACDINTAVHKGDMNCQNEASAVFDCFALCNHIAKLAVQKKFTFLKEHAVYDFLS